MTARLYLFLVYFRQTVDIVVAFGLDAEILCKVYYFHVSRNFVRLDEFLAFAVAEAEEEHVSLFERQFICKSQICFADQTFVYVRYKIAGVRRAVYECNINLRMVYQESYQLTSRITGSAQYANIDHICFLYICVVCLCSFSCPLCFLVRVAGIVQTQRSRCHLYEAFGIFCSPSFLYFSVFAELVLYEIIR